MRVVPAQEILDKIERGEPVEYDHVIVEGDLDLGKVELPKRRANRTDFQAMDLGLSEDVMLVSSSIRLANSAINGNTSFSNADLSILSISVVLTSTALPTTGARPSTALPTTGARPSTALPTSGTRPSTAMPTSGTRPSTAMPTSGTRPSTAMPTSGTRPSTAMPTSGARLSTSLISHL